MAAPLLTTGLAAFAVALVATPVVLAVMSRVGVVDRPDGRRKLHRRPIPLAGGLAVWFGLVAAVWLGHVVGGPSPPSGDDWFWPAFLVASGLICAVGLADDAFQLRGRHKLLGQVTAVAVLIGGGLMIRRIDLFGWDVELGVMAVPFTLFWLLGAINAINLIDGMDGLASTVGGMIGLALAIMAAITGHGDEAMVAAALVGGLLGFLIFNFPPAKIFLGDTGSMMVGLILGAVAVRATLKEPATVALAAPVAIWTLPILDVSMAILRRKLTGRSIYATDRGHLHHRLGQHGQSNRGTLLLVAGLCGVTTAGALASVAFRSEWIAAASAASVAAFLILTRRFGHSECMLLARRTRSFATSLFAVRRGEPPAREHRSRLQGTREWEQLWESLVAFADRLGLASVQFDVSLPSLNEEFFASWKRGPQAAAGTFRVDIPLGSGREPIGWLRITGHCPSERACNWIGELVEGLRPFEAQVLDLVGSGLRDSEPVPAERFERSTEVRWEAPTDVEWPPADGQGALAATGLGEEA